jgi:hypothetical protein
MMARGAESTDVHPDQRLPSGENGEDDLAGEPGDRLHRVLLPFLRDWDAAENLCPKAIEIAREIEPHGNTTGVYERAVVKITGETHKTGRTEREVSVHFA